MTTTTTQLPPADLLAALNRRYAVKKFDPEAKIAPAVWDALEQSLVLAPSSYGFQPWKFFVIDDKALRAKLREASFGQAQVTEADKLVVFTSRIEMLASDVDRLVKATAHARGVPEATLEGFRKMLLGSVTRHTQAENASSAARQAYIALGVFMASAAALGVDACPMGGIEAQKYDEILGLRAQGYTALCVAAAGVRAADDAYAAHPKVRFPRAEVVTHL
jgi:nitroreductase